MKLVHRSFKYYNPVFNYGAYAAYNAASQNLLSTFIVIC